MPDTRLSAAEIEQALASLPGWTLAGDRLQRIYRFRDFVEAFAFMTAVALRVQEMDHHPDWSNTYDTVRIELSTHDAGGVTARDTQLAGRIEALAARWTRK